MKRASVHLPQPIFDRLKALSEQKDIGMSELIRQAVEEYLNKTGG